MRCRFRLVTPGVRGDHAHGHRDYLNDPTADMWSAATVMRSVDRRQRWLAWLVAALAVCPAGPAGPEEVSGRRIDLDCRESDWTAIVAGLRSATGLHVGLVTPATAPPPVQFKDTPLRDILSTLLAPMGYSWRIDQGTLTMHPTLPREWSWSDTNLKSRAANLLTLSEVLAVLEPRQLSRLGTGEALPLHELPGLAAERLVSLSRVVWRGTTRENVIAQYRSECRVSLTPALVALLLRDGKQQDVVLLPEKDVPGRVLEK